MHTYLHSYFGAIGAIFLSVVLVATSKFVFNKLFGKKTNSIYKSIQYLPLVLGAVIGGWSHVFLDSIMHADSRPFFPFSESQITLNIISVPLLHLLCVASFFVGGFIFIFLLIVRKFKPRK